MSLSGPICLLVLGDTWGEESGDGSGELWGSERPPHWSMTSYNGKMYL